VIRKTNKETRNSIARQSTAFKKTHAKTKKKPLNKPNKKKQKQLKNQHASNVGRYRLCF